MTRRYRLVFILRPYEELHRDERESRQQSSARTVCAHSSTCPSSGGTAGPWAGPAGKDRMEKCSGRKKITNLEEGKKNPKPQPWNKTPFGLYSDFQKEKSSQEVEGGHNKKNAVNPEQGKQVHACAQMDTGAWTWSYFKDQTRISDTKSWSCDATWEELTISCCPCCFYLHPLALLSLKCYLGQQLKTFIWYSTLMVGFRAFLLTLLCCSNRVCIVGVVKDRKVLHIFGCNALSRWDISPIASRIKHGVTLELLKRSYLNSTGWLS